MEEEETTFEGLPRLEFFTILLSNFMKKLRLPDKFTKVLDGREPRKVKLREAGRRHRSWDVEVVFDADGHMYLGHGWKKFARAHDLQLGHFLVLSYYGRHAVFTVKVFDGSMCRRHYEYNDDATENPAPDESVQLNDFQMPSKDYVLSGKCDLTVAHKAKIHELVAAIQPKIPALVVLMKKSSIERRILEIPKDYALKYFPCKDRNIILQLPGKNKAWKCRLYIRPSGVSDPGRRSLYWAAFACDNHVKEGDIYLFQPMSNVKRNGFKMTVHRIHEAGIYHSPCARADIGFNHGRRSTKMAGFQEEPANDGEKMSSSDHEDLGDSKGASEPPFMVSYRSSLTQAQENKVLEKVNAIKSELPIFVVILSKSNICRRGSHMTSILNFSSQYAAKYLVEKFSSDHHGGKSSTTCLILQREDKSRSWPTTLRHSMQHTTHVMSVLKGWPSFALDNQLREQDLCLFKLIKNKEPLTMMVYIIRREKC